MLGLIRKDIYLIIKNFKPIQIFILIPTIFAATQNPNFLMPIFCIMISMILASQISQTLIIDETEKWNRILSAMPVSSSAEAGSKYILLIIAALLSSVILLLTGLLAESKGIITKPFIIIYTIFGFFYAIIYGAIDIPSAYKFGVYNTRYILMIFIFIPTIIPLILNSLNIDFTSALYFITKLNRNVIVLSIIFLTIIIALISFILTKIVINKRETS